jgi:hypothetical protein
MQRNSKASVEQAGASLHLYGAAAEEISCTRNGETGMSNGKRDK